MLRNYLITSWRNLYRNKGFSAINLLGLAIGMTCTMLIMFWVQDELNYNKSHEHYPNIYQVMVHQDFNDQTFTYRSMVFPLAETIEDEIPQIEQAVVLSHGNSVNVQYQDQIFRLRGRSTSANFFQVFSADFVHGNQDHSLNDPYSMVLTTSTARALFGEQNPLGQVINISDHGEVKVSGVISDPPVNSTLQFDFLMPFDYSSDYIKRVQQDWSNSSWVVFIRTTLQADMETIDKQINEIKYRHNPDDRKISQYFSFPMKKWRLYSDFSQGQNTGGMIQYVRLFTAVAFIILIIACVNFMNLSTARSQRRAKEVGIRKTLGSVKKQLVIQFFIESILLALLAFVMALITVWLLLPFFNQLVDKELILNFSKPQFWLTAMGIIMFTGLVAGSYPALFLSSFNPTKVMKKSLVSDKTSARPRQLLMVFQFMVSIVLISATLIVYQQITMIKHRDLGYDPDNLISIAGSEDTQKNYQVIKENLLNSGMVESLTRTMSPITAIWWRVPGPDWEGKPDDASLIFSGLTAGSDFTNTMGIQMLQGRDFTGRPADSAYVLLNQAAVEEMGLENPLGITIRYRGEEEYTVLGITENVVQESPFHPVEPMIIFYDPTNVNYITLRLKNGVQPQKALPVIEQIFRQYNPSSVFEFNFVDQEFDRKFATEELIQKLSNIFAALAIFICCLGLAGLAAFTIERRIKEIGMRKILGASVQQLLMLVSSDFLKLVGIAFILSVPLAWWCMHRWLENYVFRIEINFWLFLLVGLAIMLLALAVVSLNTLRVALDNPMKSLRWE